MYKTFSQVDSKGVLIEVNAEEVELQHYCELNGQIVEQSTQDSIIGAHIFLQNKRAEFITVSDCNGRFRIINIPPDSYQFAVQLLGYHTFVDSITFSANESKTIYVELLQSPFEIGLY